MVQPRRTLAVCGPTASGKSALSIELAHRIGGEVINVDSVQVFRGLDVGSAKLSISERQGVPHHVLDIFTPDERANVAKFRSEALKAIDDISARGKVPILVGGSGLYMTALLHGLADVPATPSDVRAAIAEISSEAQYQELQLVDPESAQRLNPRDRQRVSRALEIFRVTGVPASEIFARHTFQPVEVVSLVLVICRPRDELYKRIDLRAQKMIETGLIDETKELRQRYGNVAALTTLGYKQVCEYLDGQLREDQLTSEIALYTRRFAKRQMTYWRNEPLKRGWRIRPDTSEPGREIAGFDDFPERARKKMKGFRAFDWDISELIKALESRLTQPLERSEVWFWGGG